MLNPRAAHGPCLLSMIHAEINLGGTYHAGGPSCLCWGGEDAAGSSRKSPWCNHELYSPLYDGMPAKAVFKIGHSHLAGADFQRSAALSGLEPNPLTETPWSVSQFSQCNQQEHLEDKLIETGPLQKITLKICPLLFSLISLLMFVINIQRAGLSRVPKSPVRSAWSYLWTYCYTPITTKSNLRYHPLLSRWWRWSSESLLLHCCRHQLSPQKERGVWCSHSCKHICWIPPRPPRLCSRLLSQGVGTWRCSQNLPRFGALLTLAVGTGQSIKVCMYPQF